MCSVVSADSVNVEAPIRAVIQSGWRRVLARHCFVHREQSYIQLNMFKTFVERVFLAEVR